MKMRNIELATTWNKISSSWSTKISKIYIKINETLKRNLPKINK